MGTVFAKYISLCTELTEMTGVGVVIYTYTVSVAPSGYLACKLEWFLPLGN